VRSSSRLRFTATPDSQRTPVPLQHATTRGAVAGRAQGPTLRCRCSNCCVQQSYGSLLAYAHTASPPYDMSTNTVNDHFTAAAAVSAPAISVGDDPARAAGSQPPRTVASDASSLRAASPARAAPAVAPIMVHAAEPLHEAAACGDLNGVRALVAAAGDDPAMRHQRRLDGATALHVAAAGGHAAIAAFLIGAGWRLGAVTDEGTTPLHVAAACGHGPALAAMLTAALTRVRAVVEGVTAGVASETAAATATATAAATDAAKPNRRGGAGGRAGAAATVCVWGCCCRAGGAARGRGCRVVADGCAG
jgi:hypothetical protein